MDEKDIQRIFKPEDGTGILKSERGLIDKRGPRSRQNVHDGNRDNIRAFDGRDFPNS